MNNEIWRQLIDFPKYEVSNTGRVRRGMRILAQSQDSKGYLRVSFWTEKGSRKVSVHTLVCSAFIGQRQPGQVIRHIDGINTTNRVENLRYGTPEENELDKQLHGTNVCGERHHSSKLTEFQVMGIRSRYRPRDTNNSLGALSVLYGVSVKTIHRIVKRKIWKHVP